MTKETPANKMMKLSNTERLPGSYTTWMCNTGGTNITSIPKLIALDIRKLPIVKKFVTLG